MSDMKRMVLVPQYLTDFSCIGPACEDTCCVGWGVPIDKKTYKKYNQLKHDPLTDELEKKVKRNRSNPNDANYAKIKLETGGRCPFLAEDKLCGIQKAVGEEYLSVTCTTYPRATNIVNDITEKSATMSCPEVARLALLNPEPMEFLHIEEPLSVRNSLNHKIDTTNELTPYKIDNHFWELRIFTIQVLQNRTYRLHDRLIMLGLFYHKVHDYMKEGRTNELPKLIGAYSNWIEEGGFSEQLEQIPSQLSIQMKLLKEMTDHRFTQGISNQRYFECLAAFLNGIEYRLEDKVEQNTERYKEAYEQFYQPFMDTHEYILENYLVNYVFKNAFPLSGEKDLFDNYVVMVLHYAMIKMHLIGMARFHQGLNEELIIKLIQSFAKTVEHNTAYIKNMINLLRENGYTTMAYMAILIKN